jgi:hypothetical protein
LLFALFSGVVIKYFFVKILLIRLFVTNQLASREHLVLSTMACQICGSELLEPRERLTEVCSDTKCQLAWASRLQALRKAEIQVQRQKRSQLAEAYRDREALWQGIGDVQSIQAIVVPANLRKIVKIPARRKRAFRKHLTEIISQAVELRANSTNPPPGETADDSTSPPPELKSLLTRGCTTCRGRCCNGGGEHAYLNPDTILGYMRNHPQQRPSDVLEAYLSYLPMRAYEDSCVYQTKNGCALPRGMRAKISGDFFCEELRQFHQQYYSEGKRNVLFYAFEENRVVRSEPFPKPAA